MFKHSLSNWIVCWSKRILPVKFFRLCIPNIHYNLHLMQRGLRYLIGKHHVHFFFLCYRHLCQPHHFSLRCLSDGMFYLQFYRHCLLGLLQRIPYIHWLNSMHFVQQLFSIRSWYSKSRELMHSNHRMLLLTCYFILHRMFSQLPDSTKYLDVPIWNFLCQWIH